MKNFFLFIVLVGAGLWLIGFLGFVKDIESLREPGVQPGLEAADAIVVLTGGSERISTGIELLESGNGKKLFISGVHGSESHKKPSLEEITGTQAVPEELRPAVILGYHAGSTVDNAIETREWLGGEGYDSLRLVTANYHMPRSVLLFHAIMPEVTIIPYPVTPDSVKLYEWWEHPGTVELLATEYCKYLIARIKVKLGSQDTELGKRIFPEIHALVPLWALGSKSKTQ